jgi:hypothetical protein
MSAERGWIVEPQPARHRVEEWAATIAAWDTTRTPRRRRRTPSAGSATARDTPWTAVWRILTPEQIGQKFVHLRNRPLPSYIADMRKRTEEQRGRER